MLDGGRHLAHNLGSKLGVVMSAEPSPFLHDFASRAAHVDVDVSECIAHLDSIHAASRAIVSGSWPNSCTATLRSLGARSSKWRVFFVRERERFAGDHFGIRDVAAQPKLNWRKAISFTPWPWEQGARGGTAGFFERPTPPMGMLHAQTVLKLANSTFSAVRLVRNCA